MIRPPPRRAGLDAQLPNFFKPGTDGSVSGRGKFFPKANSVFDVQGIGVNLGGAYASGVGGSADALWFAGDLLSGDFVPSGGQASIELGGRAGPTVVDGMLGVSETWTIIGYDRELGFRLFNH